MSENFKKFKSMLVVALMLLSVAAASLIVFENIIVKADVVPPNYFNITAPTNGTIVYGNTSITFENATNASGYHFANKYIITISDTNSVPVFSHTMWNQNTSSQSWTWDTTNQSDGTYYINVTAWYNDSSQRNASQNNVTVYVTNTMQGTPGVDLWQGGNFSVTFNKSGLSEYSKHILDSSSTPTSSLYYGNTVNVTVNSTLGWESDTYYLYYPAYVGEKDTYDYDLKWKRYRGSPDPSITPTTDYTFEDITLNTSGIWLIVNSSALVSQANLSTIELYNITVPAWFWVNTSTTYEMEVSETSFRYNSSGAVSLTVTDADGQPAPCVVDIRRQENQSSILSQNYHTGGDGIKDDFYKNRSYFWTAGNYTAWAYVDLDDYGTNNGGTTTYGENNLDNPSDGHKHYNDTYGANAAKNGFPGWTGFGTGAKEAYNYSLCGPWDPPEYNVSNQQIVVQTGEIDWSIDNTTHYYSFGSGMNLTVHEPNGANISEWNVYIYNGTTQGNISKISIGGTEYNYINSTDGEFGVNLTFNHNGEDLRAHGYCYIDSSKWGHDSANGRAYGTNGTWKIYIYSDINKDGIEEWNATATFTMTTASGVAVFSWIDDDGFISDDVGGTNQDEQIWAIPYADDVQQPITLKFKVENSEHKWLGKEYGTETAANALLEAKRNITFTGDALFIDDDGTTLEHFPSGSVWFDGSKEWWVNVTPTMDTGGGQIVIDIDWGTFGTVQKILTVGGSRPNGTIVTISPTEFVYDENLTVEVTVTDSAGNPITNANVKLYYLMTNGSVGDMINQTNTPDAYGSNTYSFWFNKTQQSTNQTKTGSTNDFTEIAAPRNITAYANVSYYGAGYAKAKMTARKDLKVNSTISSVLAGRKYEDVGIYTRVVNSAGNTTGYPQDTGLKVRLYNESGDVTDSIINVDDTDATVLDGNDNKTGLTLTFRTPGTYWLHAYNNTYKSWETNNWTIEVMAPTLTLDKQEIIWGVDKNISLDITIEYNGVGLNGTLRLDNVSSVSSTYNKTWTNCSFNNLTSTDGNSNTSKEITNFKGTMTIYNITANNLSEWMSGKNNHYSQKNITVWFREEGYVSAHDWVKVGIIPVKIPDVTPSATAIPYNQPAQLALTVSGRGAGLANVWTSIIVPGLSGEMNSTTDADGKVTFAFTPPSTGTITVKIENRTSSTTIRVTAWSLYLDVPTEANEGEEFTVTVRNNSATGAILSGAAVTFNGETKTSDASGQVTFTGPTVSGDRAMTVTAKLEGYADATDTVTVVNVPVLVIVPPSGEVTPGSSFEVILADDAGNSVVGATLTINNKDYTSGANGIVKLTAPSSKGTYTITATKAGFADAEPVTITIEDGGIPGFEVLTLLVALGVAFIILRRRQK